MTDLSQINHRLEIHLKKIYGEHYKNNFKEQLIKLIEEWENTFTEESDLTENNVYLITYGDSIYEKGNKPLNTLNNFLKEEVHNVITDVHLLPMFPYTSDDGFSVIDYRKINSQLGDWDDIKAFAKDFRLMFDFVANHISKSSEWFQGFLNNEEVYQYYFTQKEEHFDTSKVVRPRISPLFHKYETKEGEKEIWTTFSEDQVDINFKHFPVFLEMTKILLEYIKNGASSIRLDAIGFIWKESGTTCIHLEQVHEIIKLWNTLISIIKPGVQIITETNVPHEENISYFGNGSNEANMVYQFTLPPLVQYSFATKNAKKLVEWAKTIDKVSEKSTYFNFLASHDGIGIRPVEGILKAEEIDLLIKKVKENGGEVSYKSNPDGSQAPYELNINYMDMLEDENENIDQLIQKSLAAHFILLSFIGVPAIYYHSLLGSRNDLKAVKQTGINRRINRERLEVNQLKKELKQDTRRQSVLNGLKELILSRKSSSAFSPYASQTVIESKPEIFAFIRHNEITNERVFCAVNFSNEDSTMKLPFNGKNLQSEETVIDSVKLNAYEFIWIKE